MHPKQTQKAASSHVNHLLHLNKGFNLYKENNDSHQKHLELWNI